MAKSYFRGAQAALLVFGLNDRRTLDSIPTWAACLNESVGTGSPALIVVGNKSDLPDRAVTSEQGADLAESLGAQYFETSALTGHNVMKVFEEAARAALSEGVVQTETIARRVDATGGTRSCC